MLPASLTLLSAALALLQNTILINQKFAVGERKKLTQL
jgi:hypothetical protein